MKKLLLAAGLVSLMSPAIAQDKHGQEYDISIFRNNEPARNQVAVEKTNKEAQLAFPKWSITVDKGTGILKDIYGPGMTLSGNTILEKAQVCMGKQLSRLSVNTEEWQLVRNMQNEHGGWVDYKQVIDNHKVAFSRLGFRFSTDGRLVRLKMKNYGSPQGNTAPVLTMAQALDAAVLEMPGATITSKTINNDWEWFPVPSANGYDLHPAWAFNITGIDMNRDQMILTGYVDAIDGTILYRTNDVKFDYDLTVNGPVRLDAFATSTTITPLPHLRLTVNGNNHFTDNAGFFADQALTIPDVTTIPVRGRWSTVYDSELDSIPFMVENVISLGTTFTYPTTGLAKNQHINAYYHTNIVHDYMKTHYPTFTGLDISLRTNVDVVGSCNAFYNGNSINFYKAGGGCASFADIGDIVYHEYGHGINDKFYDSQIGNGMDNGALNEGYADVWAMCITDTSILGYGAMGGSSNIRTYYGTPMVYPTNIVGEVHADGEIIAGAWWDVRENIGNMDTVAKIFAKSLYDTPDGPNGTEGEVYHEALISALVADDDDANINNGTPHFLEIVSAFAEHGIYLLSDAELTHHEMWNPVENFDAPIDATLQITYQPFLKDVQLLYRVRPATAWTTITMTETTPNQYFAEIPGQARGAIVDYHFVVRDTLEYSDALFPAGYYPTGNPFKSNIPYQYGTHLMGQVYQNFDWGIPGWTLGNISGITGLTSDNATAGKWINAAPIGSATQGRPSQVGYDHTFGVGKCLVTGNATSVNSAVGAADVDNGTTTVLSPTFDISNYNNPIIEYYRWYSNNRGSNPAQDKWQARINTPSSAIWVNVETTQISDQSWRRRIFRVRDYIPTGNEIRMAFVADDATSNGGSAVEAAVDDFMIYSTDWATGVNNVGAPQKAVIYPNPSDEVVNIRLGDNNIQSGAVGIYDLTGKKISEVVIEPNKLEYTINTKEIAAGTYFLIVKSEKMVQSQKVTVKH